jgi:Spy/CpxP family protein refolding chaperone
MEKLAEELGLTDSQKEQLKPVFQSSMEQMKAALHDDTSLTPEAKHEKMKGIREQMDQQIKSILTPEQIEKWKELKEARREKHAGFGGPGGAGAGSPANPPPITTGTAQ